MLVDVELPGVPVELVAFVDDEPELIEPVDAVDAVVEVRETVDSLLVLGIEFDVLVSLDDSVGEDVGYVDS